MKAPFAFARITRIAVGSTNPVKIGAARAVLVRVAPAAAITGHAVPSGVPDQPWGDRQTIDGAIARAHQAMGAAMLDGRTAADAVLGVGIEGGVVEEPDGSLRTCAWAAIVDVSGRTGIGGSLAMPLPPEVAVHLRAGTELGHAMDLVAQAHDTKRGPGAVGILTGGLMDRQQAYEPLVTYALARFVRDDFWEARG